MGAFSWRFLLWFSVLILGLVFFTFMSVTMVIRAHAEPMPAHPIIHVTDDPGGSIAEYYRRYQALSDAGAEIHFHGICASACSMVLFARFTGIKACADEGAVFAFHKPFAQQQDGKVMRSKKAVRASRKIWTAWLDELPPSLRRYLKGAHVPSAAEGDEQNTLLLLPASILLPKCQTTVAAQ